MLSPAPRASLTVPSCSPNYPRASRIGWMHAIDIVHSLQNCLSWDIYCPTKGSGQESRVEAVVDARQPQNAEEVRSFLGLVNFSARFIPNLASIAEPLHRLTRKQTPFVWGTEQQGAFDALKDSLTNADTLAYFDSNAEETKLITDASPVGLGAVLTQVQGGCERAEQRRSSQTEKEALGLVWGCERFHMYLYGV